MRCHHCPGRVFETEEELQAHRAKHEAIQQTLRRPGGRTYGARIEDAKVATILTSASGSQPSILPSFNISSAQASGPSTTQTNTTSSTQSDAPSNARQTGSAKHDNVDMEFLHSLAEFMRHDNSYLFFRQFSSLNVQSLLWMQTELAELENRLADMRGANTVNDIVAKKDTAELRLLIGEKLQLYNDALLRYSQVCKLDKPDETSISDVRRWIADTAKGAVQSPTLSQSLSSDNGDHAAVAQRQTQKTWAWKLTEGTLWRLLAQRAPGGRVIALPNDGKLHVWDDSMVHLIMHGTLTFILSLTLLIPLVILAFVVDRRLIAAVTACCSILLALILATLTQCRDHEIIVAVSAYAAVLMVYTQASG